MPGYCCIPYYDCINFRKTTEMKIKPTRHILNFDFSDPKNREILIIEAMPNRLEWEITTHSMEVLGLEAITAQLIDLRLFDEYDSYFSQFRLYMPSGYSQTTSLGIPVREFAVDQIAE